MKIRNKRWDDELDLLKGFVAKCDLLSAEEERELAAQVAKGDKAALQKLIHCNLRLVLHILKDYTGSVKFSSGMTAADLMQEGNIGLIRAAEEFDGTRGVRFSTYAAFHIRQHIVRALEYHGRSIRLPYRVLTVFIRYRKIVDELTKEKKRVPTKDEIAEYMGLPMKTVDWLEQYNYDCGSLDGDTQRAKYDDDNTDFFQNIADNKYGALEETVETEVLRKNLMDAIAGILTPAEQRIIYDRIGYNEEHTKKTLADIGHEIGVSQEGVRLKEMKILRKLRRLDFVKLGFQDSVVGKAK